MHLSESVTKDEKTQSYWSGLSFNFSHITLWKKIKKKSEIPLKLFLLPVWVYIQAWICVSCRNQLQAKSQLIKDAFRPWTNIPFSSFKYSFTYNRKIDRKFFFFIFPHAFRHFRQSETIWRLPDIAAQSTEKDNNSKIPWLLCLDFNL